MLAFALTPGLGVALGGVFNQHFGWVSTFYLGTVYGLLLLILAIRMPETLFLPDLNALKLKHLLNSYKDQFKNIRLMVGSLQCGASGCYVYLFAALGPFIGINFLGLSSSQYGIANIIPSIGLMLASLFSARLARTYR